MKSIFADEANFFAGRKAWNFKYEDASPKLPPI